MQRTSRPSPEREPRLPPALPRLNSASQAVSRPHRVAELMFRPSVPCGATVEPLSLQRSSTAQLRV